MQPLLHTLPIHTSPYSCITHHTYTKVVKVERAVEGQDTNHGPSVPRKTIQVVQKSATEHSQQTYSSYMYMYISDTE